MCEGFLIQRNLAAGGKRLKTLKKKNFIRLSYHKITNNPPQKTKNKQITIESGNAAQKGRYERETHARYCPVEKKCKNIRYMTNREKKMDL